jgi:hypothetical protein
MQGKNCQRYLEFDISRSHDYTETVELSSDAADNTALFAAHYCNETQVGCSGR